MARSKHDRALQLLGFKQVSGPRTERSPEIATFVASNELTCATDETGQTWIAAGFQDLTALGFMNHSPAARLLLEAMGDLSKPH